MNITFENRFATGHSNGGHFCFKLALEAPDWIDGIAAISANLPIAENLDCQKSGQFVPLLLINGTADKVNPYDGGNPVGRIGQPSDIAGLVIYLCSKAGSFMTGNIIPLDGGLLVS